MVIFHSYVKLPEGTSILVLPEGIWLDIWLHIPRHVTTHDALWKCSQFLGPSEIGRFTLRAHGVLRWLVLSEIWVKPHCSFFCIKSHLLWHSGKSLDMIHTDLVGGWPTPLKNMKVSWDYYSQYMEKWKIFQTTNQWCFLSMTHLQSVIQRLEEQTIQTSEFPPQPTCVLEMSTKILVSKRWSMGWLDAVTACYPLVSLDQSGCKRMVISPKYGVDNFYVFIILKCGPCPMAAEMGASTPYIPASRCCNSYDRCCWFLTKTIDAG